MTDEPVCAVCGLTEGASVSEVERRRIGYHPFEAAPSTDEGEARWARENGIPSVWRKRWMGYSETVEIPISLEAAIRAPLEERIARANEVKEAFKQLSLDLNTEKKAIHEKWIHELELRADAEERIRELEAERDEVYLQGFRDGGHEPGEAVEEYQRRNERLREALRAMLRAFDYWNATRGRDDESGERTFRAVLSTLAPLRALANPPSSTEGTE